MADETADDEQGIRALIERWAHAVHTGDLAPCSPTTRTTS